MSFQKVTRRFIESLFSSSPAPIVAIDSNNLVTAWNPAAERLFGWTSLEMLGKPYSLVPKEGDPQYKAAMDRVFEGGSLYQYTACRRRKKIHKFLCFASSVQRIKSFTVNRVLR